MKSIVLVFMVAALFGSKGPVAFAGINDCGEIKVSAVVTNTTLGNDNGEISLFFEKTINDYVCFLFASETKDNQLKITESKIKNLKKGVYNLFVQDKKGCSKHLIVTIN